MLYQLNTLLQGLPGARLMTYISFRAILAAVLAMLISIYFGKWFIGWMKRHQFFETQRDEKTDPFNVGKKGVPTMGGLVILIAILLPCLLVGRLNNIYMLLMIVTTVILGALGFADDYIKTFRHNKDGLNGWIKIGGQVLVGLIVGLTLRYSPEATMNERVTTHVENEVTYVVKTPAVKSTRTTIPFFKHNNFNYADLFSFLGEENKYRAGWIFFVLLTVFVVAAVSNGANLNDVMDGMCAGNSAIIGVALIVLAYVSGSIVWANYFDVMYIPHSEELVVFLAAFVGALIGYLWWNSFPAQIFMGDTGSLAIGGIIAVTAIIIHKELLLPLLCFIFFIESVSVLLQTNYARYGNKRGLKLRFFKRAPLHDTFRVKPGQLPADFRVLLNWPKGCWLESKITTRFWIITIMMCALAIVTLKIR
jgi:phospho-N-acetylmuramoyl-pentapeptide-transferase